MQHVTPSQQGAGFQQPLSHMQPQSYAQITPGSQYQQPPGIQLAPYQQPPQQAFNQQGMQPGMQPPQGPQFQGQMMSLTQQGMQPPQGPQFQGQMMPPMQQGMQPGAQPPQGPRYQEQMMSPLQPGIQPGMQPFQGIQYQGQFEQQAPLMQQQPGMAAQDLTQHPGLPQALPNPQAGIPMAPRPPEHFKTGMFDCWGDCKVCCLGFWCLSCLYGDNHARVTPGAGCFPHCMLYACLPFLTCIFASSTRRTLRTKYALHEEPCSDCCVHCVSVHHFCCFVALAHTAVLLRSE